ncbi:MAG: penicillin acylase family protein [Bacteroidota bacterium]
MKTLLLLFFPILLSAQELTQIEIIRDEWGVPHIYAPSDEEVCYGLAWAQCEDDFKTVQEQMLAVQGRYGEVRGKEGIVIDFAVKFLGFREVAEANYETQISPKVKKMIEAYADGVSNYAAAHPEEVLLKGKFEVSPIDLVVGYMLGVTQLTGTTGDLLDILSGEVGMGNADIPKGSNAIAISKHKTTSNETFLAINSHQPMEGWYSWYEAHLGSDEGWNILGGTFPGGITIFLGANEHLGWAHTVNHADFSDVYELSMHPSKENFYQFDGEWLELKERKYTSKMKVGFLKIPISRTIYESKYGPTFKTKNDKFYALRFVSGLEIGSVEQWYAMNKATDFQEFKAALSQQGLVCTNIAYADKEDNIYYISNGKIPVRDEDYDWKEVLPGNTSETLWENEFIPLDSLPQVLNPEAGYVFNTNNTPFSSTATNENPKETPLNETMGYHGPGIENNRSKRFLELINQYKKLSWEDFKRIKFDQTYPQTLQTVEMTNLELLLQLEPSIYPDIADAIQLLNAWDRKTDLKNTSAALFIISVYALDEQLNKENRKKRGGKILEEDAVRAIRIAKKQMLKDYGKINIPLGEVQRHIRGEVNLPIAGGPDVLAAIYSRRQKNGQLKTIAGDCYIQLVRFGENGVQIESSNVYGASAKENSLHFTDQMEMFVQQKLKSMTLNWEEVRASAVRRYHPLKVIDTQRRKGAK